MSHISFINFIEENEVILYHQEHLLISAFIDHSFLVFIGNIPFISPTFNTIDNTCGNNNFLFCHDNKVLFNSNNNNNDNNNRYKLPLHNTNNSMIIFIFINNNNNIKLFFNHNIININIHKILAK